ncbi:MAG: hypothetical protein EB078_05770 [Proteobacteria bacterium]|nr:hypothetical protein [Pseudomonadota bacterium]NDC24351.1 hypothetical protein [Pseudomonadota bacterium]NDD04393.1 hypothetical protein [Pseudomonadota bacterium]NDG25586.1 hypothetical protein [Pseudomonadota bacterium]
MKGKLADTVRKWWVLALVATLALSLTSCGRKKSGFLMNGQGAECEGSMGYFSVATYPYQQGLFEVRVYTWEAEPGDVVSVTIADSRTGNYKNLLNDIVLQPGQEISAGFITQTELEQYDTLSITPAYSGIWADQVADKDAVCDLPYPNGYAGAY